MKKQEIGLDIKAPQKNNMGVSKMHEKETNQWAK